MKKLLFALIAIALIGTLSGCGTFGNGQVDNPLGITPYKAGRIFVFTDVVTKPIQPDEVKEAVDVVYAVAVNNVLNTDMADETVRSIIAQRYPDATPEFREVLFNLYKTMTIRMLAQINANPKIPNIEVIDEFNRGIRDALALYNPSALPPSNDLGALLDSMESGQ